MRTNPLPSSSGRRTIVRRTLGTLAGLAMLAVAAPAAHATPITSPGGGEKFNIHPGDKFDVGYDFTISGNSGAVTVNWTNPKAVVNFTCSNGTSGSFTVPMPNATYTTSGS